MRLKLPPKHKVPISAVLDLPAFDKLQRLWVKEVNEGKKTSKNAIINRMILEYEEKPKIT